MPYSISTAGADPFPGLPSKEDGIELFLLPLGVFPSSHSYKQETIQQALRKKRGEMVQPLWKSLTASQKVKHRVNHAIQQYHEKLNHMSTLGNLAQECS